MKTSAAQEFFGTRVKDFRYFPVFGFDSLQQIRLKEIVPDVEYSISKFWNRQWNDELSFWFNPPFHNTEQGRPLTLRGNQAKIAEPAQGHHRVKGVAGSGKTQALAYRAGRLASMGLDIMIISEPVRLCLSREELHQI